MARIQDPKEHAIFDPDEYLYCPLAVKQYTLGRIDPAHPQTTYRYLNDLITFYRIIVGLETEGAKNCMVLFAFADDFNIRRQKGEYVFEVRPRTSLPIGEHNCEHLLNLTTPQVLFGFSRTSVSSHNATYSTRK